MPLRWRGPFLHLKNKKRLPKIKAVLFPSGCLLGFRFLELGRHDVGPRLEFQAIAADSPSPYDSVLENVRAGMPSNPDSVRTLKPERAAAASDRLKVE